MLGSPAKGWEGLPVRELGRRNLGGAPLLSPHHGCLPFLQALEKYCRTEAGFSGIQDVYSKVPDHDNKQQTFFLAETLK